MTEDEAAPRSEWLEMTDAQFEEIRDKADLILRTLPGLLEKSEATARATLAQKEDRALETLSRKSMADQLLAYANGSLQQAEYMRGLLGMLDSTWRCLAEIRRAYREEVTQRELGEKARAPGNGDSDG